MVVNRKEQENAAWIGEKMIRPRSTGKVTWVPLFVLFLRVSLNAGQCCNCACEFWWSFSALLTNVQSAGTNNALFIWDLGKVVIQSPRSDFPFTLWKAETINHKPTQTREKRPTPTMMSPILAWPSSCRAGLYHHLLLCRERTLQCQEGWGASPKIHGEFMAPTAGKSSQKHTSLWLCSLRDTSFKKKTHGQALKGIT